MKSNKKYTKKNRTRRKTIQQNAFTPLYIVNVQWCKNTKRKRGGMAKTFLNKFRLRSKSQFGPLGLELPVINDENKPDIVNYIRKTKDLVNTADTYDHDAKQKLNPIFLKFLYNDRTRFTTDILVSCLILLYLEIKDKLPELPEKNSKKKFGTRFIGFVEDFFTSLVKDENKMEQLRKLCIRQLNNFQQYDISDSQKDSEIFDIFFILYNNAINYYNLDPPFSPLTPVVRLEEPTLAE